MFVAAKQMTAHGPDGQPVTYQPGDELPQFMSWPHHIRRSMLAQNWVEFNHNHVAVVVQPPALPPLPDAIATDAIDPHQCPDCDRTFRDTRGLNVHKAQAHKSPVV